MVHLRRQVRQPPRHALRGRIEPVDRVGLVPGEAADAAGEGDAPVRRERNRVELPLLRLADRDTQHTAQLAGRQGPQPDGLVVGCGGEHAAGRIDREAVHRGGVGTRLDADEGSVWRPLGEGGGRAEGRDQPECRCESAKPAQEVSSKPDAAARSATCTLWLKLSRLATLVAARVCTSVPPETTERGVTTLAVPIRSVSAGA